MPARNPIIRLPRDVVQWINDPENAGKLSLEPLANGGWKVTPADKNRSVAFVDFRAGERHGQQNARATLRRMARGGTDAAD